MVSFIALVGLMGSVALERTPGRQRILVQESSHEVKMNEMLNGMYSKMNTSADACTNFYEYACGGWESKEEIPDDRSSWSSFGILSKSNKDVIEKLLASSKEGKANEYYHSCMDQNGERL
eukprot:1394316-Amorphochlora_amoeboformis.AAC.2